MCFTFLLAELLILLFQPIPGAYILELSSSAVNLIRVKQTGHYRQISRSD